MSTPLLACLLLASVWMAWPSPAQTIGPVTANATADKLRLEDVLRLALERSPEAKGANSAIRAMEHRVPQAKALPDPTVAVGWAGKLLPFDTMAGDASSYRGITVSEQFPSPGKLRLQGQIAARDVEAARAECEAARRRTTLAVELAFAEYFYLDKAIASTRQNKEFLQNLASIAEAQYRVGKAMQQDVLRAQVEISMLMEKQAMLEQEQAMAAADLNAALQQSPETPLPAPENLDAPPIQYTLDEIYALANGNDTGLARNQTLIERDKLSVALAERQNRPDIGVSYMFEQRTDQPAMNGVTVSVALPLFRKTKQHQAMAEAAETLLSTEKMQESQRTAVRAEVRRQMLAAETAQRLITLYSKAIVPQSSLALESAMSEYQVGKVDFLSLLTSFTTQLNYETETYRQIANYRKAVANIESLTGQSITADRPESSITAAKGAH
jgi:outer membrane protein TolC